MKIQSILPLVSALVIGPLAAEPVVFNFEDPKGVNNVVFMLDAPLESINGTASGISGSVSVDLANPSTANGKIVVDATSLIVPNPVMMDHLHGENWLNTSEHGQIIFEISELKNVQQDGDSAQADAVGTFTLMGISKNLEVPIRITYLPGRLKERGGDVDGDLVVIRSNFSINRSEFGIQPGQNLDKVAEQIELTLSIAGIFAKS